MTQIEFELRTDHITLDALLKATGLAHSGGGAKVMVISGQVQVDGQVETRRGCKLRPGMVVAVPGTRVRLVALPEKAAAVAVD
jgi:ribosome-associated protein